jgi:hypothetical protein
VVIAMVAAPLLSFQSGASGLLASVVLRTS